MTQNLRNAWKTFEPTVRRLGSAAISESGSPPSIAKEIILYPAEGSQRTRLCVAFAPFSSPEKLAEQMQTARVLFVGLTPGRQQACRAIEEFLSPNEEGANNVSFAGSMRANMISMLDDVGLNSCLQIETVRQLFTAEFRHLVCSTSLLRFPVFVGPEQKNFSGTVSQIQNDSFLRQMVDELFLPLLQELRRPCLVVPMGKTVEYFCSQGNLASNHAHVLRGFPHPSGGNGHRVRTFEENRDSLRAQIAQFGKVLER